MLKTDGIKLPVGHSKEDLEGKLEKILKLNKLLKGDSQPGYSYRVIKRS
jgi:hypothetical protein